MKLNKQNVTFLIKRYVTVPRVLIALGVFFYAVTFYLSLTYFSADDMAGDGCGLSNDIGCAAEPIHPLISLGLGVGGVLLAVGIIWSASSNKGELK